MPQERNAQISIGILKESGANPVSLAIDGTNQYIGKTVEWIMDIQEIVARKEQPAERSPPIHACAG
jgi:hypothetical protein